MAVMNWTGVEDAIPASVSAWGANTVDPTWPAGLAVITGAQSKTITTSMVNYSVTVVVPATCINLVVAVWSDSQIPAPMQVLFMEAGLYVAAAAQPWQPRPAAIELTNCQRFYELMAGPIVSSVVVAGNKTAHCVTPYKTTKRAIPTIVCYSAQTGVGGLITEYTPALAFVADHAQGIIATIDQIFFHIGADSATAGNNLRFNYSAEAEIMT